MAKRTVVELEELRNRLREAEETLSAIRNGEVDSLVVTGPHGDQVFSLKGAEQPYRVFVEQMAEGAVTMTDEGTILYSNLRFANMMRSPLEKVIGGQIQSFIRPADHEQVIERLRDPDGKKIRVSLIAGDQSVVPAQLALSRMPIGEDTDAVCLVVTDMTEHEEKRELAAALDALRIIQDQLQQQNAELSVARAAADAANEAKDNFLASLSHELRTPLAPIMMTVTMLERNSSVPEQVRSALGMIRRNVELEARLIDDLLDITRIVRGKVDLKPQVLDAHQVVQRSLEICSSDIQAKQLRLVQDLNAHRSYVTGDPVRIQQVLWNLIRNAVKFTPDGGIITVRTEDGPEALRIIIADTGIGIEGEAMKKIFTPFEQTGKQITRQFGGLGLGLAISRRLAELQGGTVTAASEGVGRGATFVLSLPCADRPTDNFVPQSGKLSAAASERLRILLVEDHHDTRASLGLLLRRKHEVYDVENMSLALAAAGNAAFDLVISDLGLPDGTGFELMQKLRQMHNLRGICLSGYGMEHDVSRSREAGFEHHLTKPVDLDKLEAVIASLGR